MRNNSGRSYRSKLNLEPHPKGIILPVRAHAAARRNAILGVREGALRVAVTAAPEKGKANRAIITLLSKVFGVPKSAIELISGGSSLQKRFVIVELDADQILQTLQPFIADCEQLE
jgi:uncharacterized protein (TIGR00251 family)